MRWEIGQGARYKIKEPVLEDEDGPLNLTGAVVYMHFAPVVGTAGAILRTVPVIDTLGGRVRVEWVAPELDVIGVFKGEFISMFPGGRRATVPSGSGDYLHLVVKAPVAPLPPVLP